MWKLLSDSANPQRKSVAAPPKANPWHAVSVVSKGSCCDAAKVLSSERYLSHQAPRLPLAECSRSGDCVCSYQHHADRRGQSRRAAGIGGLHGGQYQGDDRRRQQGRRVTDSAGINDWKG